MKRWFYTDPLAAAWMAKHLGMRYPAIGNAVRQYAGRAEMFPELIGQAIEESFTDDGSELTRFCIHPDSLYLLEPQAGDLMWVGNILYRCIRDIDYNLTYAQSCPEEQTQHLT